MSPPLVSIVLPTYNGARYLDQAVRSCRDQTDPDWELIIVDDASTDDTPVRIARYVAEDPRVRSVRHERNRRLPGALNTGFSQAKGQYLTWTSDDNCYRPQALSEMVAFLESDPAVDIVYADYTVMDEAGRPRQCVTVGNLEELGNRNCIGPCFLYRRRVQETLGGYAEDLFLAEDYEFWLRAAASFRFQPLHRDLYLYRLHDTSLTQRRLAQVHLAAEEALKRHLPKLRLGKALRAQGYLRLARMSHAREDWAMARAYLFQALRYAPWTVIRQTPLKWLAQVGLGRQGTDLLRSLRRG